ncbi:plasmid mobilization protein [Escherichia coli]|nr:plasmid mobilization protein [Escherichia coli]
MGLKFTIRDHGSFSGGLLPFLPVCCRVRAERVSAVRTMRRYGKSIWGGGNWILGRIVSL